ncbi:hypothetical protein AX16_006133 [Volvariella volvacea WC 439]|nr:hypothetical protein AX16_006133 [Volvariella volvacea WC 439]
MSDFVSLTCLVYGEKLDRAFEVEIGREKSVLALKDHIANKGPSILKDVRSPDLELYKARILITDDDETNQKPELKREDKLCPAKKIGKLFPAEPPEDHVHIIVKLPVLSKSEFLELCPPPLGYIDRPKSTKTTNSAYARTPQSVVTWDGFKDDVNGTTWDDTPKYSREPDFIQKDSDQVLRLVIEVKSKWVLSVDDLVATYEQNFVEQEDESISSISVFNQLRQIFGYLSHNHLRFGALTTYDKTWFLCRPPENPGQLRISPAIQCDGQQPTLFQCLVHLTRLARDADAGEEHAPLEFFDWGSFRVLSVLGSGRTGTVFKAVLHGEVVALKICDLWQHPDYEKELLNEVEVYHALKDLQGDCVPRFKGAGYTAGGLFIIATDIVGRPLEHAKSLSDEERQVIQRALLSIHRHGFIHNDIREDNILIERNGHQFYASLIDFAFSKKGCRRDFRKEMGSLARLFGQS